MTTRTAAEILEAQFLEIRCELLNLASALDRTERGQDGAAANADPRWQQIHEAIVILGSGGTDRAERIQMLFSDPYDPDWDN